MGNYLGLGSKNISPSQPTVVASDADRRADYEDEHLMDVQTLPFNCSICYPGKEETNSSSTGTYQTPFACQEIMHTTQNVSLPTPDAECRCNMMLGSSSRTSTISSFLAAQESEFLSCHGDEEVDIDSITSTYGGVSRESSPAEHQNKIRGTYSDTAYDFHEITITPISRPCSGNPSKLSFSGTKFGPLNISEQLTFVGYRQENTNTNEYQDACPVGDIEAVKLGSSFNQGTQTVESDKHPATSTFIPQMDVEGYFTEHHNINLEAASRCWDVKGSEENQKKIFLALNLFKCTNCELAFDSLEDLRSHAGCVHDLALFSCNECDGSFQTASKLKQHSKTHGFKRAVYRCDHCHKAYVHKKNLDKHVDTIHTAECGSTLGNIPGRRGQNKPFKCEYCNRRYSRADNRDRHVTLVHAGQIEIQYTAEGNAVV